MVVCFSWEGNRRSAVALAMRRRLRAISTGSLASEREGKLPAYIPVWEISTLLHCEVIR